VEKYSGSVWNLSIPALSTYYILVQYYPIIFFLEISWLRNQGWAPISVCDSGSDLNFEKKNHAHAKKIFKNSEKIIIGTF